MSRILPSSVVALVLFALIAVGAVAEEIAFGTPVMGPDASRTSAAAVAGSGDSYVAVWTSSEGRRLFARAFDRRGRPVDKAHLIGIRPGHERSAIVWLGDRYRVFWISTDYRYALSQYLEVIDLDTRGKRIEGSGRRIARELSSPAVATDGARTLVVARESPIELRWLLVEKSGDVRQGSLHVGYTAGHKVVARGGDFEILWNAEGTLWRFELFSGELEQVPVAGGAAASFAATTDGESLWVAAGRSSTGSLTIVGPGGTRIVPFAGRSIQDASVVDGEIVVTAWDGNLYRVDTEGNLLQQIDPPLDGMRLSGVVAGADSLLLLSWVPEPGEDGSMATVRLQRTNGMIAPTGVVEVLSVIVGSQSAPVIASNSLGRSLLVWSEDLASGEPGKVLRGAILDDVTGAIVDPVDIAAPVSLALAAVASDTRFLVNYRTGTAEDRIALLDFHGNVVSDQPLPFEAHGRVPRWAWSRSRFVAVVDDLSRIMLHTWDGAGPSEPMEIGRAEDTRPDEWSSVGYPSIATGSSTIMVSWSSMVSSCQFPPCASPSQVFARLFDRVSLQPLTEAFPVGERNQQYGIELAWDGSRYGLWSLTRGTLLRLTESGTPADEGEISVRVPLGFRFSPVTRIAAYDGVFAIVWYEETLTPIQGIAMRVVQNDGSLSPLRAFPIYSYSTPLSTSMSGGDVWIAYTRSVHDEVFNGARRVFVRRLSDVPLAAPPRAPRIREARIVGSEVTLEWDDESDDEIFFEIVWGVSYPTLGSCRTNIVPADATSARVTCNETGPFSFRVRAWNAAGMGEPSEEVTAVPPERRRPVRRD